MALNLDNQTVVAQPTMTYAPKEDALYLTVARSKYGHLGVINPRTDKGAEEAGGLAALGKVALSGKFLDVSVQSKKDHPDKLTIRIGVSKYAPPQRASLAERIVTAHLNS